MAVADPLNPQGYEPASLIRPLLNGFGFECNVPYRHYPWTYKRREPETCVAFGHALRECEEDRIPSACEEVTNLGKECYAQRHVRHDHGSSWQDSLFSTDEGTEEWRWQAKGPDLQLGWLDRVCFRVTDGSTMRVRFTGQEAGWTEVGESDHMAITSEIELEPPLKCPRSVLEAGADASVANYVPVDETYPEWLSHGQEVMFACDDGFIFNSADSERWKHPMRMVSTVCGMTKDSDLPQLVLRDHQRTPFSSLTCRPYCPAVEDLRHASLTQTMVGQEQVDIQWMMVGEHGALTCEPGLFVLRGDVISAQVETQCLHSGDIVVADDGRTLASRLQCEPFCCLDTLPLHSSVTDSTGGVVPFLQVWDTGTLECETGHFVRSAISSQRSHSDRDFAGIRCNPGNEIVTTDGEVTRLTDLRCSGRCTMPSVLQRAGASSFLWEDETWAFRCEAGTRVAGPDLQAMAGLQANDSVDVGCDHDLQLFVALPSTPSELRCVRYCGPFDLGTLPSGEQPLTYGPYSHGLPSSTRGGVEISESGAPNLVGSVVTFGCADSQALVGGDTAQCMENGTYTVEKLPWCIPACMMGGTRDLASMGLEVSAEGGEIEANIPITGSELNSSVALRRAEGKVLAGHWVEVRCLNDCSLLGNSSRSTCSASNGFDFAPSNQSCACSIALTLTSMDFSPEISTSSIRRLKLKLFERVPSGRNFDEFESHDKAKFTLAEIASGHSPSLSISSQPEGAFVHFTICGDEGQRSWGSSCRVAAQSPHSCPECMASTLLQQVHELGISTPNVTTRLPLNTHGSFAPEGGSHWVDLTFTIVAQNTA